MKKRVLCYGDSNTWGFDGKCGKRYGENIRWTGKLQTMLGAEYTVVEEGQNGRTFLMDDTGEINKCGLSYLLPCLESHDPLDFFIVMLGSNDLKARFNIPESDVALGLFYLLEAATNFWHHKTSKVPHVLVMSPPYIEDKINNGWFAQDFVGNNCLKKSRELAKYYKIHCNTFGCDFFDASTIQKEESYDGIHMTPKNHAALAAAVFNWVFAKN